MFNIKKNIPLKNFTTFRIGGPAKFFVEVKTEEELMEALKYAKENNLEFFVLGGCSNVLVSDKGFDGLIIKLKNTEVILKGTTLEVNAGVSLAKIVKESIDMELSGLEWAFGIPGTIGGAIYGNAGAFGGTISSIVEDVTAINVEDGKIKNYKKDQCEFDYRSSIFKKNTKLIIISASIKLEKGDKNKSEKIIKEINNKRDSAYPAGAFSAGSFFKNPVANNDKLRKEFETEKNTDCRENKLPAKWLIEKADLLGKKIGGAMVSEKHANFIINTGTATAEDVIMLASLIKQQVRDKFGVELQEEVQYLGF